LTRAGGAGKGKMQHKAYDRTLKPYKTPLPAFQCQGNCIILLSKPSYEPLSVSRSLKTLILREFWPFEIAGSAQQPKGTAEDAEIRVICGLLGCPQITRKTQRSADYET
jgi:hypothetical protein